MNTVGPANKLGIIGLIQSKVAAIPNLLTHTCGLANKLRNYEYHSVKSCCYIYLLILNEPGDEFVTNFLSFCNVIATGD